jgi:hypothetical protein
MTTARPHPRHGNAAARRPTLGLNQNRERGRITTRPNTGTGIGFCQQISIQRRCATRQATGERHRALTYSSRRQSPAAHQTRGRGCREGEESESLPRIFHCSARNELPPPAPALLLLLALLPSLVSLLESAIAARCGTQGKKWRAREGGWRILYTAAAARGQ